MKKIKLNGKLNLNKETVSQLNDDQLKGLNGGAWFTLYHCGSNNCATKNCPTGTCPPPVTSPAATCPTGGCTVTEGASACQSACNGNMCP